MKSNYAYDRKITDIDGFWKKAHNVVILYGVAGYT